MIFKKFQKFSLVSLIFFLLSIFIMGNMLVLAQEENNSDNLLLGTWEGKLEVSGISLRVVVHIKKNIEGKIIATMDSPDQGIKDIVVDEITFKDGVLNLDIKSVGGFLVGEVQEDFLYIKGELNQAGSSFPLLLERVEEIGQVSRPQEPKKPYPYKEEEVTYTNKEAGITLAGTLTLPSKPGSFPAAILISGSGAQDRDSTIFGHKPFLVLSDYLTRLGIAVLRVDDRGMGESTGGSLYDTSEDFADDVIAGIDYLKSRKDIDHQKIGLIGHSEGGVIAPMVAAELPEIKYCVMLGGTGLNGEEVLLLQMELLARANGANDDLINRALLLQKRMFAVLKEEENNLIAEKELRKIFAISIANFNEKEKQVLGISEDNIDSQLQVMLSSWYRNFLLYDPQITLMKVKCPVLALVGEKDLQVAPRENLQAIEEALRAGGNKNYKVVEMPGLNHLLQTAETGAISEYALIKETIAPEVLELVGKWILDQVSGK
ncbi:MAG: alpha/beta fold hydrolase [Candidatus Caldatribacteriota bacterium]